MLALHLLVELLLALHLTMSSSSWLRIMMLAATLHRDANIAPATRQDSLDDMRCISLITFDFQFPLSIPLLLSLISAFVF